MVAGWQAGRQPACCQQVCLTSLSLEHAQCFLAQPLHVLIIILTPCCLIIILTIISINIILQTTATAHQYTVSDSASADGWAQSA